MAQELGGDLPPVVEAGVGHALEQPLVVRARMAVELVVALVEVLVGAHMGLAVVELELAVARMALEWVLVVEALVADAGPPTVRSHRLHRLISVGLVVFGVVRFWWLVGHRQQVIG